ncbi:MAG: protein YgfX [Candidatus Competibacteraceae bacterium]
MPPLTLELVPSRRLVVILITCHCLAWVGLIFSNLSPAIRLSLGACIGASLLFQYARYGNSRSRWFIDGIGCSRDGQWTLRSAAGTLKTVELLSSYVYFSAVILTFAAGKFRLYPLVVLPDSADPDSVRRLRVWLQNSSSPS